MKLNYEKLSPHFLWGGFFINKKGMEKKVLNYTKNSEEVLITKIVNGKTHKFIVSTIGVGEYNHGKLVVLKGVRENFETFSMHNIGFIRYKLGNGGNLYEGEADATGIGCFTVGLITFEKGVELAIEYLDKILY